MRIREIMETASAGATGAGSVAPVMTALGTQSRMGGSLLSGKYVTGSDPTPNTPKEYKRNKNARGRFKNSPGN
jgi:hypothetical protein